MTVASEGQRLRQAVGVFHHADRLAKALQGLIVAGVKVSDLGLLGRQDAITTKLKCDPRMVDDSVVSGLVKGLIELDADNDAGSVACSTGTLASLLRQRDDLTDPNVHPYFGRWLPERLAAVLQQHMDGGGLLLWVVVRSGAEEQLIGRILLRNSEANVQIHDVPLTLKH